MLRLVDVELASYHGPPRPCVSIDEDYHFARMLEKSRPQADKGKSSRFSLRSPGNAKPVIVERIRRIIEEPDLHRSAAGIIVRAIIVHVAPKHPGNALLVGAFSPFPHVP